MAKKRAVLVERIDCPLDEPRRTARLQHQLSQQRVMPLELAGRRQIRLYLTQSNRRAWAAQRRPQQHPEQACFRDRQANAFAGDGVDVAGRVAHEQESVASRPRDLDLERARSAQITETAGAREATSECGKGPKPVGSL